MLSTARLQSLNNKHAHIEDMIIECEGAPYVDTMAIRRLKREKLRLKEEIEGLYRAPIRKTA